MRRCKRPQLGGGEVSHGTGKLCAMHFPRGSPLAGLRTCHLVSWPDDSSLEEEDDGQTEEEEDLWEEEEDPTDVEEQGEASPEPSSSSAGLEQGETKQEVKPRG